MKVTKKKKVSKSKKMNVNLTKLKKKKSKSPKNINHKSKEINLNKVQLPKLKPTKKHRFLVLKIVLITLLTLFIAIISFIIFIVINALTFDKSLLYTKQSSIIYDKDNNEIARLGSENREIVSYDDLPQVLIDAIVATEDSRFFQHDGFDIARFMKASMGQLSGNSGAGGASTLTMQVVKNTYTDAKQTHGISGLIRKFTDIYMSIFKVEKKYTKEEIMEFYVNAPWLGNGTYGVEQEI